MPAVIVHVVMLEAVALVMQLPNALLLCRPTPRGTALTADGTPPGAWASPPTPLTEVAAVVHNQLSGVLQRR